MTKLLIFLPCFNEEATLPRTIAALPKRIGGVDHIETMVIDDGSDDATVQAARDAGVHHIVQLPVHKGLAQAFATGLETALQKDADVIVTTDADNQYKGTDIARLIDPILRGEADMVIGVRDVRSIAEFSSLKKFLHRVGSAAVRVASGVDVSDPVSGFRAFSKQTAQRLCIRNTYTYTVETLIQAGRQGMRIESIPIERNDSARPSRLISSAPQYIARQAWIMLGAWMRYGPLSFFGMLACVVIVILLLFFAFR